MREVYLDNSATTQMSPLSAKKLCKIVTKNFGNADSLHRLGIQAEKVVDIARSRIARAIGCREKEITFVSGGTEANNLAILGAVESLRRNGSKIVTTAMEHSSVHETMKYLQKRGFEVVYLKPNITGSISKEQIISSVDEKTILVSVNMVNNEVGAINPVECIRSSINKGTTTLIHVDAVQAFGKIPVIPNRLGIDLMSISAHKIHGPKGVGALFIRDGVRISPMMFGGTGGLRPGTLPVELIGAFGKAVQEILEPGVMRENYNHVSKLNERLRVKLSELKGVKINSSEGASPYILNLSTMCVKAEAMLNYLSEHGVFVSSGSACARGVRSRVLQAMGLSERRVDTALRVSFSRDNTTEDVDIFVKNLHNGLENLLHI